MQRTAQLPTLSKTRLTDPGFSGATGQQAARSVAGGALSRVGLALALVLGGASAQAQGLLELYDAAKNYDAAVLAARAQARSAEFKAAQSDALMRPSATATGRGDMTNRERVPGIDGTDNNVSARVDARYPLFNRGNLATVEQARKTLESAQADLSAAEQDLMVRLSQAYFDVLASMDALGTTRASKAAITEQLASARRNFEVGTATITDAREAQARFDLVTAQEIAAENDLRTKSIALDQLVGRSGVAPRPLPPAAALPATEPADAEAWVGLALGAHPSVRKAALGFDIARLESAKASAAALPTVDATGAYSVNKAYGSRPAAAGQVSTGTLGVQLNWTLYNGGLTQNRVRETAELEIKSRNDLDAARRTVSQSTRQAYFAVQSGSAQVKALEAAEASSRLALEATQVGYRVGVRVNLDVLNAQTQLFQTRRDLAKARYDVLMGGLRLRLASGQLKVEDLAGVSGLLAR
jgi:outer membrane protein